MPKGIPLKASAELRTETREIGDTTFNRINQYYALVNAPRGASSKSALSIVQAARKFRSSLSSSLNPSLLEVVEALPPNLHAIPEEKQPGAVAARISKLREPPAPIAGLDSRQLKSLAELAQKAREIAMLRTEAAKLGQLTRALEDIGLEEEVASQVAGKLTLHADDNLLEQVQHVLDRKTEHFPPWATFTVLVAAADYGLQKAQVVTLARTNNIPLTLHGIVALHRLGLIRAKKDVTL